MNSDQLGGIIRAFIPGIVAVTTYAGMDNATVTSALTAIATLVVAVWSAYTNKPGTVIPSK